MEYNHARAVVDNVNVDYDVYRIRTQITEGGSRVEAGLWLDWRDRQTRAVRSHELDDDLVYDARALDREVVAEDQIRTVLETFRDKLFTEIFPGRTHVPKTLMYAKDDSHADDIVRIVREVFGESNDFAQKITYRTGTARIVSKKVGANGEEVEEVRYKSSGIKAEDLLSSFRISYNPRIAVTVDMIATGTDIKPLEIVMFMRAVKSRNFFEQMKGRGVRVINPSDLLGATPDARTKDRFVLVDCVGVCEQEFTDAPPLERKRAVSFKNLLNWVAFGSTDADVLSSLAGRLAALERQLAPAEREALAETAGGVSLKALAGGLVDALDPERHEAAARAALPEGAEPTAEQVAAAARALTQRACAPFVTNPALRTQLEEVRQRSEQAIDRLSQDVVLEAAYSAEARERASALAASFEQFIREHKDEITAVQVLYSRPYAQRLRFGDVKALAQAIEAPPRAWTREALWRAYETLDQSKVRGSGGRVLTDVVALVRYALRQDDELVPFPEQVEARFARWLAEQEGLGRRFTDEQRQWLELIRDHVAASMEINADAFDLPPLVQHGGLGRAYQVFGEGLGPLLEELNEALAA